MSQQEPMPPSIERQSRISYRLLGPALGLSPKELGFRLNRVLARKLIQQIAAPQKS